MKFKPLPAMIKRYIVTALAVGMTPTEIVLAVRDEHNVVMTRQAVQKYDPTKPAGEKLSAELRELFESVRAQSLEDLESLPLAYRAPRVAALSRAYERAVDAHDDKSAIRALAEIRAEMTGIELVDIDPPAGDESW